MFCITYLRLKLSSEVLVRTLNQTCSMKPRTLAESKGVSWNRLSSIPLLQPMTCLRGCGSLCQHFVLGSQLEP